MTETKECSTFVVMGASVGGCLNSKESNACYAFSRLFYREILLRRRSILRSGELCTRLCMVLKLTRDYSPDVTAS